MSALKRAVFCAAALAVLASESRADRAAGAAPAGARDVRARLERAIGRSFESDELDVFQAGFDGRLPVTWPRAPARQTAEEGTWALRARVDNYFCLSGEAGAFFFLNDHESVCWRVPDFKRVRVRPKWLPGAFAMNRRARVFVPPHPFAMAGAHWMAAHLYGPNGIGGSYDGVHVAGARLFAGGVAGVFGRQGMGFEPYSWQFGVPSNANFLEWAASSIADAIVTLANSSSDHLVIMGYRAGWGTYVQFAPMDVVDPNPFE